MLAQKADSCFVREGVVTLGIQSFLRSRLFGRHTSPNSPTNESQKQRWGLRDALLKCSTLTEAEVDEYIAYASSVVYEDVPLDYELEHPDAEVSCLYADGIAQVKTLARHTAQISPETLEKVQRVLPLIVCQ